jgi:hypothetical protein
MRVTLVSGSLLLMALNSWMLGCSSSNSNASAVPATPIKSQPSNKVVNTLTSAEAIKVCEEVFAYLGASLGNTNCLETAISSTSPSDPNPKSACQTAYNQCVQADAGLTTGVNCSLAPVGTADCTATIGQVNQCISDEAAATKTAASSLSCDKAGQDAGASGGVSVTPPASCTSLQSLCATFAAIIPGA